MKFNIIPAKLALIICAIIIAATAQAYVTPKIGGSQVTGIQAPMLMPEIWFDGQSIHVTDEYGGPWDIFAWLQSPYLRPLVEPNQFDPSASWKVLIGKAYNYQYGWDSGLLDTTTYPFPPGSAVWVKVLNQSPELESYYKDGGYAPIFGTPDVCGIPSPDIWLWNKGMRHNAYAVADSFYGRLFADYKVYLGDATTGAELVEPNGSPAYGSALVTFNWLRPCLYILQGDLNADCVVDFYDYAILANQWLDSTCSAPFWCDEADINKAGSVDLLDMELQMNNWLLDCQATPDNPQCSPRPGPW
jgi:hypothetical protein